MSDALGALLGKASPLLTSFVNRPSKPTGHLIPAAVATVACIAHDLHTSAARSKSKLLAVVQQQGKSVVGGRPAKHLTIDEASRKSWMSRHVAKAVGPQPRVFNMAQRYTGCNGMPVKLAS